MDIKASSGSPVRSASALLFCRVCQAVYRQPKLLPCLHSFCRPCLVGVVKQGTDGTVIVCPLCSHQTIMPPSGVTGIPDNCFLARMCKEYMTDVQSHLAARSQYPISSRSSSEFTALRSKLTEELSRPQHSPSFGHRFQDAQLIQEGSMSPSTTTDSGRASAHSTANALEAIRNMSRLQTKIMSLQGEALRVTYAVDHVNQCMIEWHQHKEDLKRAVQRRSAQFQFFIKRMEHQLIAQIEGKQVDDKLYVECDRSKTELRKILRNILHEVSVLKSVQELGKDPEINALSSDLLGKSVGMTDVNLKKFHFDLDVPAQTIEEIVTGCIGGVRLNPEEINVFAPEMLDFTEVPMDNLDEIQDEEDSETFIHEDDELEISASSSSSKRSFSDNSSRYSKDIDALEKDEVREHLVQFQNARETLRTRRREILVHGQQAREDASPLRDESYRHRRSALRKGRVQSLDRIAIPVAKKGNIKGLPSRSKTHEITTVAYKDCDRKAPKREEDVSDVHPELTITFQYGTGASHYAHGFIPEEINVPSPVIEEVPLPTISQRKLVKQTSDPQSIQGILPTSEEDSDFEVAVQSRPQSVIEQFSSQGLLNPNAGSGLFTGRRHSSDQYTVLSQGECATPDHLQEITSTRLARRAISSAADRKAKIDFLRENWQKRKEILIQNEGFVSPDSAAKQATKHYTRVWSPTPSSSHGNLVAFVDASKAEGYPHPSADEPNYGHMEQIKESPPNNKNEMAETGDLCNEDAKTCLPFSPNTQTSDLLTQRHKRDLSMKPEEAVCSEVMPWTFVSSHHPIPKDVATTSLQRIPSAEMPQSRLFSSPIQILSSSATTLSNIQTTTTTTRMHSRLHTESIDVDSRVAAMYSGKDPSTMYTTNDTSAHLPNEPNSSTHATIYTASTISTFPESSTICTTTTPTPYFPRYETDAQSHTLPSPAAQSVSIDSTSSEQPRRYSLGSTPYDVISRRHTIDVGRTPMHEVLQMASNDKTSDTSFSHDKSMTSKSRIDDDFRIIGSSGERMTPPPAGPESTDTGKIKDATFRAIRETTGMEPSPLKEGAQSTTLQPPAALVSQSITYVPSSSSPTPPSPTAGDGVQKGRLREITRKKKERWRHLTIH